MENWAVFLEGVLMPRFTLVRAAKWDVVHGRRRGQSGPPPPAVPRARWPPAENTAASLRVPRWVPQVVTLHLPLGPSPPFRSGPASQGAQETGSRRTGC